MPSTPRFTVTQDDTTVYVEIHVPYVRVSELEYHIDGCHFTFYCKPYLLNLTFPHPVVDDDRAKALYDINKNHGTVTVHLPKEIPNTHFPDLDLLTTLLQRKKWKPQDEGLPENLPKPPLIEVVSSSTSSTELGQTEPIAAPSMTADSSLLSFENTSKESINISSGPPKYGFNNRFSDFFKCWHGELHEVISLPTPETSTPHERNQLRVALEEENFDIERYLMDFANRQEDEYFRAAMEYIPFWHNLPIWSPPPPLEPTRLIVEMTESLYNVNLNEVPPQPTVVFTDQENELLLRLPRKEYLPFSPTETRLLWHGLLDILTAYCYDMRATQNEPNVESAWTVSILSSTLSWLDTPDLMEDVVKSAIRRAITYPFLRQWDLIYTALEDVAEMLQRGKRVVLRVLLAIYSIFEKSETYYLLNTLYIEDYATWIQLVSDETVFHHAKIFRAAVSAFQKDQTGWALTQMEQLLYEDPSSEDSSDESSEEDSDSDDEQS